MKSIHPLSSHASIYPNYDTMKKCLIRTVEVVRLSYKQVSKISALPRILKGFVTESRIEIVFQSVIIIEMRRNQFV